MFNKLYRGGWMGEGGLSVDCRSPAVERLARKDVQSPNKSTVIILQSINQSAIPNRPSAIYDSENLLNSNAPLVPPKPKEFERA
jgi:hypothetical protein